MEKPTASETPSFFASLRKQLKFLFLGDATSLLIENEEEIFQKGKTCGIGFEVISRGNQIHCVVYEAGECYAAGSCEVVLAGRKITLKQAAKVYRISRGEKCFLADGSYLANTPSSDLENAANYSQPEIIQPLEGFSCVFPN